MGKTEKRMRICAALLILNLCFIWGNSLMPGSVSEAFSNWVKDLLASLLPSDGSSGDSGFLVRKLAHFSEFTCLGLLLSWLFAMLEKKKHLPILFGVAAACIDETIQLFVPGRGPGIRDVCIDSFGVLTGGAVLWLSFYFVNKYRSNGG